MPFAAFFVAVCLVLCIFDAARKVALCILLGAAVGMASVLYTANRLERIRVQYAARPLVLTAEVESVSDSYYPGVVDAVLRVEKINDAKTSFRVECETLPECEAGQRVQGRFVLSVPAQQSRVGLYADGIVLLAEPDEEKPDFKQLGQSSSFRARTHRLQQRLSAALRRRMDGKTGGVLAAMTVGDRTHLSPALRSAYRGAGLAHVLVVSGMHVSILCGEVFLLDARRKKERCYAVLRLRAVWKALLALLLVGVTGFTPSVLRAAAAVWVSALGAWLYAPPDTLTSLAVAGIAMTAGSSYAVCDIGFELSFAAVLGTVAGGAPHPGCMVPPVLEKSKKSGEAPMVFQTAGAPLGPCRKRLHFGLCVCGDLSGAGAARAERQHLGSGLQRGGPLAHPAHDAAGPRHGVHRAGARPCAAAWCALRTVRSLDRPARPLGRLDSGKTGRGALL